MRDRLIELIDEVTINCETEIGCLNCQYNQIYGCKSVRKADHLLANCEKVFGLPLEELNELVMAKKENRLIVPPCKVGDTVYTLTWWNVSISEWELRVTPHKIKRMVDYYTLTDVEQKEVFPTLEEAEKALAEMRENNNV